MVEDKNRDEHGRLVKGNTANPTGRNGTEKLQKYRKLVKVSKIIKFLQGVIDDPEEATKDRVQAAKILLAKALPDQKVVEVGGVDGEPLTVVVRTWEK